MATQSKIDSLKCHEMDAIEMKEYLFAHDEWEDFQVWVRKYRKSLNQN